MRNKNSIQFNFCCVHIPVLDNTIFFQSIQFSMTDKLTQITLYEIICYTNNIKEERKNEENTANDGIL